MTINNLFSKPNSNNRADLDLSLGCRQAVAKPSSLPPQINDVVDYYLRDIQKIESIKNELLEKLSTEMTDYRHRRNLPSIDYESDYEIRFGDDDDDDTRYCAYKKMYDDIKSSCNSSIQKRKASPKMSSDERTVWSEKCRNDLQTKIQNSLKDNKLDKYSASQKFGILLLNIASLLVFPIALPLKKVFTHTLFYSFGGKLKTSAEESLQMVKELKL